MTGPRDVESVLDARYWLTDAGMSATDDHWAAVRDNKEDA